eukprot:4257053-Lingulodinium_polyedra.AAC.1
MRSDRPFAAATARESHALALHAHTRNWRARAIHELANRLRATWALLGNCLGAAWVLLGCCLRTEVRLKCCLGAAWGLRGCCLGAAW